MKRLFFLPIALALAAYLLLPLPGQSAPLSQKIEKKRGADRGQKKRQEGVLTTTISGLSTRIDGLQGEINATQPRLGRAQDSLDDKRDELLRGAQPARGRPRPARAAALRACTARAGCSPRAWSRSTRPTSRTRSRSCSRPTASATCSSRPSSSTASPPRTARSPSACGACATGRTRQAVELAKLEDRVQVAAEQILRVRDQIAAAKEDLVGSQGALVQARGKRRSTLAQVRDSRHAPRGRPAGARAPAGAHPGPALRRRPGRLRRPDQAGLGSADLARQRPGRVALRAALGPPARGRRHRRAVRHADPRRRLRQGRADGLGRRLRQLHLRPAHRQPLHVLRAPVALRHLQRRRTSARAR